MRVLVTGASGYLGRALVGALTARGHIAVAFARSATASGLMCAAVDGDVRDERAVRAAAAGCDAICHSAALVSVWRPRRAEFDEVNVGGFLTVLHVAHLLGVPRVLYTSSFLALPPTGAVTPLSLNDYQRTKVLADRVATEAVAAGVPLVRVYPGVIYGPGPMTAGNLVGGMIADHLAGRLPGVVGADRRWSYAFIDDVATGHVTALERGEIGARYRLCGENARQMRVFEIVRQLTAAPLPRRIPLAAAAAVALLDEARARLGGLQPKLTVGTLRILNHDWAFDSDLAARDLDYRITPLSEGIRRVVAAIRAGGLAGAAPAAQTGYARR